MNNLGFLYQFGKGVAKDPVEAVKWHRKAAELGHASAMNNLAGAYYFGHGVSKDQAEAVKWFRKAARLGNEKAQRSLQNLDLTW